MIFDDRGLIVGTKEDPGDSLHRFSMYLLGSAWFSGSHPNPLKLLSYKLGKNWVRHPSPGWWSDPDRLSRDQSTPLVICLAEFFQGRLLREFFFNHLKRGFFFTNTRKNGATIHNHGHFKYGPHEPDYVYDYSWKMPDFIGPEFLAIYIRAFGLWWLYPLLCIFDLETLIGSIHWRFKADQTDVLNHLIVCEYGTRKLPTPISILARKLISKDDFNRKMHYYFGRVGLLPMFELWKL